jgi:predicted membrane-bound mannosyltransferase
LDSVNTHLPLRKRIRIALESQRKKAASAASLANATPEQLRELASAVGVFNHLAGNRERYAQHVASLPNAGPQHFNSLASLGNQIEDAQTRIDDATRAVYGSIAADPVTEEEIEGIARAFCQSKGIEYDPNR